MVTNGEGRPSQRHGQARLAAVAVVVLGVALFAVVSLISRHVYNEAEDRLLSQRTKQASAVLEVAINRLRSPLDAAAQVAAATDGSPEAFIEAMEPLVGDEGLFASAALYRAGSAEPIAVLGDSHLLSTGPALAEGFFRTDVSFHVVSFLEPARRLGYAVVDDVSSPAFVAYAESALTQDPTVRQRTDQPFAELDYAMFLGSAQDRQNLITASVSDFPMGGRTDQEVVEFGDEQLLLVMRPIGHLSSDLFASLWWAVLIAGGTVTVLAAWVVHRLVAGRTRALELSAENQRLYEEQRQIAETLQLSLLPQRLSTPPGVDVAARYWPAGTAALIGGDFYDAFQVSDGRWAVAIGDVCGKGISSASLIGLARHTLRSVARHTDSPAEVLRAVHQALAEHEPPTFATVCFAFLMPDGAGGVTVTMALGGHPFPLVRHLDGTVETIGVGGSLLGMFAPELTDAQATLAPGDLLMLYTDGLTDAPGTQGVPMEEIHDTLVRSGDHPLDQLSGEVRMLKRRRRPHGSADDTAVVLLRVSAAAAGQPAPKVAAAAAD